MLALVDAAAGRAIEAELDRIVAELDAGVDKLPEDAIREAREHRELIVPRLVQVLKEAIDAAREGKTPKGNAHFFALFLLTEFESHESFPVMVEAFSLAGELPSDLFGEAATSTLPSVLALFTREHPETLERLIDDRALNQYVRWAAAETYLLLVRDGRIRRDDAVRRLRLHLRQAIEENNQELAAGLVCELANFAPQEALDDIRDGYRRGVIDESIIGLDSVERSIVDGEARWSKALEWCPPTGIPDTIEELRGWASFQEKKPAASLPEDLVLPLHKPSPASAPHFATGVEQFQPAMEPIVSRGPRVGRNDPCPCGSGKKFKKCCGARS